jgi:hypothetical protein
MRPGINLTKSRFVLLLALALMSVAGLAACGGGGGGSAVVTPPPAPPPAIGTGITVFPGVASVPLGGKAVFTAYVPSAPTTTTFTWAVTGSGNGSITTDATGKGDYVAPTSAPAGAVTVTVTATVNSVSLGGSATVTISALPAGGVAVSPASISVAAGSTFQFSATANGGAATVTSWQVNGTGGGDTLHGTIDANGNYTAPAMPPPGGSTTITAITAGGSASANTTVVFSNNSLSGPYAYSYTGDDGSGFLAVIGSFTASNGLISGSEDATDVSGGGATALDASISGSTYSIGPDGRGTVTIIGGVFQVGESWQIAITGNPAANPGAPAQHVFLVRFDKNGTGNGTIDQQNTIEAGSPFPTGNYVFGLSGLDGVPFKDLGGFQLATAGKFFSNGGGIGSAGVWDVNDAGFSSTTGIVTDDTTLTASYVTASSGISGSVGRGTLTLFTTNTSVDNLLTTVPTTSTFTFVFYVVDNTHVKVIEVDDQAFLSGDIFNGPSTNDGSFSQTTVLKIGNYAFTVGGASSSEGPYSAGGVFGVSSGGTGTTSGVMDINNGGVQIPLDKTLSISYSVDTNLGRIAFTLSPSGGSSYTFAGYTTSSGSVEMVETDDLAVASGMAFPQTATGEPSGSFAINVSGASTTGAQAVGGQVSIANGSVAGTLDFSDFIDPGPGVVDLGLQLASGTTIVAPDANGRGADTVSAPALVLKTSSPNFGLVYYVVNPQTVLLMETDATHVILGTMDAQF